MTPADVAYCELLFTTIDRKVMPTYITDYMYQRCDEEMKIYVDWLLNRWVMLRNNINHYPKKNNHKKFTIPKKVRFNFD